MPEDVESQNLDDWYTAKEAADALTKKSKRIVRPAYLRTLVRLKKVRTKRLSDRAVLYLKSDVEEYTVEPRGKKSAEAMKARAEKKPSQ